VRAAVDPNNPVVTMCAEGMRAESEGHAAEAKELFERAWQAATDDYEACIAAHYLARHQETREETLAWNEESLRRAELVGDERIAGFLPSLFLNLGHCHEELGDAEKARTFFLLAEQNLPAVPVGPYGDMLRDGVARALERNPPPAT
jgi:tetratricopeptide (TPR) repeat protein